MPVYEYVCKACNHGWEIDQKISDEPLQDCPKCKQPEARRQIGLTMFTLRGGGWYADGYSRK